MGFKTCFTVGNILLKIIIIKFLSLVPILPLEIRTLIVDYELEVFILKFKNHKVKL